MGRPLGCRKNCADTKTLNSRIVGGAEVILTAGRQGCYPPEVAKGGRWSASALF
jgi:hypothetical protein